MKKHLKLFIKMPIISS